MKSMLPDFRIFKEKLEIWMFLRNVMAFVTLRVSYTTRLKADLTCGHHVQPPPQSMTPYAYKALRNGKRVLVRMFKESSNFKYFHLTFLKIF